MLNRLIAGSALLALSLGVLAAESSMQATAGMSELMTRIIQPTSDAVFYVSRFPPDDDSAWRELENMTLMLAESSNLLLMPGYSQTSEQWLRDTLLMRDAAVAAWEAAQARNLEALMDLNGVLYESCESCHNATR